MSQCHLLHPISSVIADSADSFGMLGPTLLAIDTGDILDVSLSEALAELEQNLEQTGEEGRGGALHEGGDEDGEEESGVEDLAEAVQGANMGEEGQGGSLHEGGGEVGEEERGDEYLAEAVQGANIGEEGQGGALHEGGDEVGEEERGDEDLAKAVQGANLGEEGQGGALQAELGHDRGDGQEGQGGAIHENMGSRVRIQSLEGTPVSGRIVDLSFPSVGVVTR